MKDTAAKKLNLKSGKTRPAAQSKSKTGFYSKVLDQAEQLDFMAVSGTDGLDDEIALLRVMIKSILENDPENYQLMIAGTNMLAKLVKTRYNITKIEEKSLGEAIKGIIKDIGIPLGVAVINKKL